MQKRLLATLLFLLPNLLFAQDELLSDIETPEPKKDYITGAFKSSRVINGHSIEFIGKNVLDFRILHRFGLLKSGISDLFGLDNASMRFGLDYGLAKNLTLGVGRSNVGKELDGFIKFRPLQQQKGKNAAPVSVVLISGGTVGLLKRVDRSVPQPKSFFGEAIIGRKFSNIFSLQLSPIYIYRSQTPLPSDDHSTVALGIGGRLKFTKRIALVADYNYVVTGLDKDRFENPLAIGFDIETGGHVFQLHFTNATGMNEKAFITNTSDDWGKGAIRFGFNISRVFDLGKGKNKL